MCKYHKLLFLTEVISCNNPKLNEKTLSAFCQGNHGDTEPPDGLQKKNVIHAALYVYKIRFCCSTLLSH